APPPNRRRMLGALHVSDPWSSETNGGQISLIDFRWQRPRRPSLDRTLLHNPVRCGKCQRVSSRHLEMRLSENGTARPPTHRSLQFRSFCLPPFARGSPRPPPPYDSWAVDSFR